MDIGIKILLSLLLGAFIGLERESYERIYNAEYHSKQKDIHGSLGVRTFALITTLGAVVALLYYNFFSLFLTINIAFMALTICYYVMGSILIKDNGMTTEVAIIFAYLLGQLISLEAIPAQIIIALTVLIVLILSQKQNLRSVIAGIQRVEVQSFISYAIIALVVLPFIPNINVRLMDIPGINTLLAAYNFSLGKMGELVLFNPFKLWFIIALITGVEVVGYVLEKTIGQKKGWIFTSIAGGFISSTAVTQSLAQKSQKSSAINQLVGATILANLASFFQIFILIAPINGLFLVQATKFIFAIILVSAALAAFFFLDKRKEEDLKETREQLQETEIFALKPAMKFALLFLGISVLTKTALLVFGSGGFILSSALAAVTGIDAVTLNLSELAGKTINYQTALWTLLIVNAINLLTKAAYSFIQGKREFAVKFTLSVLVIITISFLGVI